MSSSSGYSYLFKYIIIGNGNVGKSCLFSQFIDQKLKDKYDTTIGTEFGSREIALDNQVIKLQVWDTAGSESFRSITRSYYRGAAGVLLLYDISNRKSFQDLRSWLDEVQQNGNPDITFLLIGNKCDLEEREISFQEGEDFAKENNMIFLEVSAKTAYNVDEAFIQTSKCIAQKIKSGQIDPTNQTTGVKVGTNHPSSNKISLQSPIKKNREINCCKF